MQRHVPGILIVPVVGAVLTLAGATRASAATCEGLMSWSLQNAVVTTVQAVAPGAFAPPAPAANAPGRAGAADGRGGAAGGRGGAGGRAGGPQFTDLPAFCRVTGTTKTSPTSSVKFEVWMPTADRWNGNFMANGFAFYGGTMNPGVLAGALRQGYATATTDAGGDGTNAAAYMSGNPEKVADWNERAWHETTLVAKALMAAYYGNGPKVSYWEACGGGTRQALKEVARFPTDYDAVAAGGLSNGTTFFTFAQIWQWEATHKDPASLIPREKLQVLNQAAMNACDAKDGLTDGLLSDPERCTFDPGVLQCSGTDTATCLTAAQVQAARKMYSPVVNPRTRQIISGPLMPGTELSWNSNPSEAPTGFAADFFRHLVFQNPAWDYRTRPMNYDADVRLANRAEIGAISAVEPDVRAFLDRGGKLLMYVGWNDTAIPPLDATRYYQNMVSTVGRARAEAGVRLFMVPGMGHCPANANATSGFVFDPNPIITQWKEAGKVPNQILVTRRTAGAEDRPMLVCPYPQLATYTGTGNINDAANFVCSAR
ncbi:MAG: hypothetical protein A3G76_06795 [Acidobacteria bacterium RIFCSPLOWO2_12_FULL_65_11]|nr:MAG: hypothetical protein A3G76_06795 [Acidobacteria bacterium RIFCSPLOWO2_12_FULL_65_11]